MRPVELHGRLVDLCVIVGDAGAIGFRTHSHDSEQMERGAGAATVTHNIVSPVTLVGAVGKLPLIGSATILIIVA